jgi:leader peptidase (prepilin peptidase)/N-methyltransferase
LADAYLKILIPIFGLLVGSFANVLIYRIPREEEWVRTPSHCPRCGRRLKWYDMVPVLSWLVLGGKCRSCGGPVSPAYPLVELINGLLWLLCVMVFGIAPFLPVSLALSTALLVVAAIDWKTQEIPDGINIFLLAVGVLWNVYAIAAGYHIWAQDLIGFFSVSVPLFIIAVLVEDGMGGGDIKLTAVCGLILGWKMILLALGLASVLGTAVLLPAHIIRKKDRKSTVPFGPFLAAGVLIAMCFGQNLIAFCFSGI